MIIGFVGLGIMGSRMAANLLESDYKLIINNRTKKKADKLIQSGAKWADSPGEVAEQCDIIFTMLSTPEAVRDVALGENGILYKMHEDALWVDCSTVNPSFSREMAEECNTRNIRFIDAPVSGSLIPAEKGELLFLAGGNKNDIDQCIGMFNSMGRDYIHAGKAGMGASLKMLVNMLMGDAMAAFVEAMNLGVALGFEKNMLMETLMELPAVAPIIKLKKENFKTRVYEPHFPLKWMQKDMHLASVSAFEKDIPLPVSNAVKELFAIAKHQGLQDKDFSALMEVFAHNEKTHSGNTSVQSQAAPEQPILNKEDY